ncbi:MAG: 50S ribosomal protein L24 [Puniceicoccales bacterium]|jgi:large subunit ribosomal protein L24|nr:50S ribosomal protein L24 [Puniceicoccales bacterium]
MKQTLKRGDEVIVIAGDAKDQTGKVIKVLRGKNKVIVEGVAVARKHMRKSQEYPNGTIIDKPMPIHLSNVARKSMENESEDSKNNNKNA